MKGFIILKTFQDTQSKFLNNLLSANSSFLIKYQSNYRKSFGVFGIIRNLGAVAEDLFYSQASISRYNKFLSDSARNLMCSKVSDDGLSVKWNFRRWVEEIINSLPDSRRIGMTIEEFLDPTFIRPKPLKLHLF